MDEQEIPRNCRSDFCDNPSVSPIEFNRNSSLIALNPPRALNISYEKIYMDDDEVRECPTNQKLDFNNTDASKIIDSELLDTKFCANEWSLEFSYDDTEFEQLSAEPSPIFVDSFSECLDKKISLNDPMELETPNQLERSHKRKSQKWFHQEAKRRSLPFKQQTSQDDSLPIDVNESKITFRSVPFLASSLPTQLHMEDDHNQEEEDFQSASSVLFDSFSANESMVLSPIAHEMSNINGKELKDVSNFFQCDISSFE